MIYFLYGSDTYRLQEKLKEILEAFISKSGANFDLLKVDGETDSPFAVKTLIETASLFSSKKLAILKNISFSDDWIKTVESIFQKVSRLKDTIIIWVENDLSAKSRSKIKELEKFVWQKEEFKILEEIKIQIWIKKEAEKRGYLLGSGEAKELAMFEDSWAIANEIEKRSLAGGKNFIEKKEVIFILGDNFFVNPLRALEILPNILRNQDQFQVFSYLLNHTRTLYAVKLCRDAARPLPASIKIHPFVLKKSDMMLKNLSLEKLQNFLEKFLQADAAIKTGQIQPQDAIISILISESLGFLKKEN